MKACFAQSYQTLMKGLEMSNTNLLEEHLLFIMADEHVRSPSSMMKAMVASVGTERSELLAAANEILVIRAMEYLHKVIRNYRSLISRMNQCLFPDPTLIMMVESERAKYDDFQLRMSRMQLFMRDMVPFMKSFSATGQERFNFPFPCDHSPEDIKHWLNARVNIASPCTELRMNAEFTELNQLQRIFGINSYDHLRRLNKDEYLVILKVLNNHEVNRSRAFQDHMKRLKEREVLPMNFRIDTIYKFGHNDVDCILCALYLDLLKLSRDVFDIKSILVMIAWGRVPFD